MHDGFGRQRESVRRIIVPVSALTLACRSLRACQPPAPPSSPRVLMVRFLALSSRQTTCLTCFLAGFLSPESPGLDAGLCSVPVAGALASARSATAGAASSGRRWCACDSCRRTQVLRGFAPPLCGSLLFFCRSCLATRPRFDERLNSACFRASSSRIAVCSASIGRGDRGGAAFGQQRAWHRASPTLASCAPRPGWCAPSRCCPPF